MNWRLTMPPQFNTPNTKETPVSVDLTFPSSGNLSSPNLKEISKRNDLETPEKTFLIKKRGSCILQVVQVICERSRENLSTVLSSTCAFGDPEAKAIVKEIVEDVALKKGVKRTVEELVGDQRFSLYVESLRVPDWVLLYFKTKARISGNTWHAVINITKLGRTGKSSDTPILLNLNQMKASKKVIFGVCKEYMDVKKVPTPLQGYQVDLYPVLELIVREQRLHKVCSLTLKLLIKIDGRPFCGRNQVLVGLVACLNPVYSVQSAKSVYPLAIANCKENRVSLKALLKDVNEQKRIIKNQGIFVDGMKFNVEFDVSVDYKTLILLLVKKGDLDFQLGGRGVDVEFCFICNAIRGCKCHDVAPDETCLECLRSKCNIVERMLVHFYAERMLFFRTSISLRSLKINSWKDIRKSEHFSILLFWLWLESKACFVGIK
ncbi:uncharacterized protein [Montipora foliosa]|uniref:uncharacterized protein n=1 Tax=Montipora foliosa TaxID=591990 RepID=UPI0035F11680